MQRVAKKRNGNTIKNERKAERRERQEGLHRFEHDFPFRALDQGGDEPEEGSDEHKEPRWPELRFGK